MAEQSMSPSMIRVWLTTALLSLSVWGPVWGQTSPTPEVIQAKSILAGVGEHVELPLVSTLGSVPAVGWQVELNYDASKLSASGAKTGTLAGQPVYFATPTPGVLRTLIGPMAALSAVPTGNNLYLPLTPITGGSKLITLANAVAADATPTSLPITLRNGLIADPNDLVTDSDGDGIPDSWEVSHGLDPLNPADAALDPDHDGVTNLNEYRNGTSPFLASTERELSNRLLVWAKTLPGMGDVTLAKIAVASDGSLYLLGSTRGATDFDPNRKKGVKS